MPYIALITNVRSLSFTDQENPCAVSVRIILIMWCALCVKGPDELFEVISQALLSSVDRDCISGWGGIVHVV